MHEIFRHTSTEPSEAFEEYVENTVFRYSEYFVITKEKSKRIGHCTACGSEYAVKGYKHNEATKCPKCKRKLTVKLAGYGMNKLFNQAYVLTFEKSEWDEDALVGKGYYVSRSYKDFPSVKTQYTLAVVYLFSKEEQRMVARKYCSNGSEFSERKSIFEYNNTLSWVNIPYYINYDALDRSIENTYLKYSDYKRYCTEQNNKLLKYLQLFSKYPQIELLEKINCYSLIWDRLNNNLGTLVNFRAKEVHKMLKLSKKDFRDIVKNIKYTSLSYSLLRLYNLKDKGCKLGFKELEDINLKYDFESLQKATRYTTLEKIYKYLNKQKDKGQYFGYRNISITYRDYLDDCRKLNIDMTSKNNLFPKNLQVAHQNTITQIKILADKELDEKMKRIEKERQKYLFNYKNFITLVPKTSQELIDEGKSLNHCVGGYARRHAEGSTTIIFIRECNNPTKAFYTLEISDNKVKQVHGKDNCNPTEDVEEFLEVFKTEILGDKNKKIKRRVA